MKDSFSQTFLPIPFGALFSSRSHSFFWRGFDKLFLSVSCFFFFFFFLRGTIVFLRKRKKRENIDFSISDFSHDNTHKTVDIGKLILFLIKINATDNTNSSYEQ